jgi:hypothetical protein
MIYIVKRLNITGGLDEHTTPIEVIKQCMSSHGFEPVLERLEDISDVRYRRKCIQKLMLTPSMIIRDLRKAARYVNSDTIYTTSEKLIESLEFLHQWETREMSEISFPEGLGVGPLTEMNPKSLDSTILYRLCKRRGLQTQPSITSEDMFRMLLFHTSIPASTLQGVLINKLQNLSSTDLINGFYHMLPSENILLKPGEIYNNYILTTENNGIDPLGLHLPTTDHEAVILAALNYKLNISGSSVPRMEYALLFKFGPENRSFPIDSNLQQMIQRDPFALRLDQRFDPSLPERMYIQDNLRKMAVEEGWTLDDKSLTSPYEYLKTMFYQPTFFSYGKGPMSSIQPSNEELIIERDKVVEKDPLDIVLFGSRNDTGNMFAISWSELIMTFENYKEFRNVFISTDDKRLFEMYMIRKLIQLCKKPCIDQNIADRRKRLLATIERINLENKSRMKHLSTIRETLNSTEDLQTQFKHLFDLLYRLSLCMRSLKESDPFPESGEGGNLDSETTQLNVSLAAITLNETLERYPEWIKTTFINLPLVIYYPREDKFSSSEASFEGHTIGGRLKIVHSGENTTAISSCLRLSSNWFLSTVYYYQSYFGFPIYFDITKITHIG